MSRRMWASRLAILVVALIAIVSMGACRSARRTGAAVETTGVRAAPASVRLADSPAVSFRGAAAAAGAATEREPETSRMAPESEQQPDSGRARYPRAWRVEVPAGTRLDTLRREMDAEFSVLPPKDLEDRTPLPIWFRVYLRKKNPDLPTHGPYQYPRTARRLLQWMVAHPDSVEPPGTGSR
jgi:hypothetical protein